MFYLGVMSGTSGDGVDVALVSFEHGLEVITVSFTAYPQAIKAKIMACASDKPFSASEFNQLDADLGLFYGNIINEFIAENNLDSNNIKATGLHGQTINHQPPSQMSPVGNTWQIGSASITCQLTGIPVIAKFREMDMAFGGEGAPLAPVFHQHIFARKNKHIVVLNLGGIANITSLSDSGVVGFDTGPANCLMDDWINKNKGLAYDKSGLWASEGQVNPPFLNFLLSEDFFSRSFPKSTGRELFNLEWLNQYENLNLIRSVDVQRTLLQLTVESIVGGIKALNQPIDELIICGGGSKNSLLINTLSDVINVKCKISSDYGISPDFVEAALMAWLAKQHVDKNKLDLTAITGASRPLIYGICYDI